MQVLLDDYGFAEAGWHRNTTVGDIHIPYTDEVVTPGLDELVKQGIYSPKIIIPYNQAPVNSTPGGKKDAKHQTTPA